MSLVLRIGFLAGLLLAAGCKNTTPPGHFFGSSPPGALVVIDGKNSGYVTPCMIDLAKDETFEVRFQLAGFEPREITLVPNRRSEVIPWDDGSLAPAGEQFPLFLSNWDPFTPIQYTRAHSPARVFVRLRPISE